MREWITYTSTGVVAATTLLLTPQGFEQGGDRTIRRAWDIPRAPGCWSFMPTISAWRILFNRATFDAFERGLITSASILVPCPWFPEVARWAQAHPEADLGIHLALNSEWTGSRLGDR